MRRPFFSVIMPLYNHETYVKQAIESVLAQTFHDWELIVCDDGSTDGSFEIVAEFKDPRINLLSKPNGGCASALNACITRARGKFICWLSSDDVYSVDKLHAHYIHHRVNRERLLSIAPHGDIVNGEFIDSAQVVPSNSMRLLHFLMFGNYINGLSVCMHRSLFLTFGLFENYRYVPDVQRWFAFFKRVSPYYISGSAKSYSRQGTSSTSGTQYGALIEMPRMLYKELKKHGPKVFLTDENGDSLMDERQTELLKLLVRKDNLLYRMHLGDQVELIIARWLFAEQKVWLLESALKKLEVSNEENIIHSIEAFQRIKNLVATDCTKRPINYCQHLQRIIPVIANNDLRVFMDDYINYEFN
jgi:glycosyltransferase involved in cell wall biosynthesis